MSTFANGNAIGFRCVSKNRETFLTSEDKIRIGVCCNELYKFASIVYSKKTDELYRTFIKDIIHEKAVIASISSTSAMNSTILQIIDRLKVWGQKHTRAPKCHLALSCVHMGMQKQALCIHLSVHLRSYFLALTCGRPVLQPKDGREINGGNANKAKRKPSC